MPIGDYCCHVLLAKLAKVNGAPVAVAATQFDSDWYSNLPLASAPSEQGSAAFWVARRLIKF